METWGRRIIDTKTNEERKLSLGTKRNSRVRNCLKEHAVKSYQQTVGKSVRKGWGSIRPGIKKKGDKK